MHGFHVGVKVAGEVVGIEVAGEVVEVEVAGMKSHQEERLTWSWRCL